MNIYLQTLSETAQIVLPIFLLLISGFLLRHFRVIDSHFIDQGSRLVFTLTLPVLIFLSISRADFLTLFNVELISYFVLVTVVSVAVLYLGARRWIAQAADQGVFVQGAFRSNFGIIGLAMVFNMLGEPGLAPAALLLAFVIPVFNVLSILVVSLPLQGGLKPLSILKSIITNPLILAVIAALPFSLLRWPLPGLVESTGAYFADLTLPLALLAIGGALDVKYLRNSSKLAIHGTLLKLVILPLLLTLGAWLYGFQGDDLAILFILFSSPTAAASFVMAQVMGGNARLAANIVALTTLGSILTMGTGIYLLKLMAI
ncbi:MAG: AEC family transporter [Motiliproteus sp.]|nr:AEC family transporter [Motiliproteus sp.]MCW9051186.1 AEC family transporter [Motiliproteus sp.]